MKFQAQKLKGMKEKKRLQEEYTLLRQCLQDKTMPENYLISQKFLTEWIALMEQHSRGYSLSDDFGNLKNIFLHEQNHLVSNYVQNKKQSFLKMSDSAKKEIAHTINIRAWYLFWYLYNDFDSSQA